jgi:hypothetical protein
MEYSVSKAGRVKTHSPDYVHTPRRSDRPEHITDQIAAQNRRIHRKFLVSVAAVIQAVKWEYN